MASKNQLLGSGVDYEALARQIPAKDEVQKLAPAWRYHESCPKGKVIKTDKVLAELDEVGWKDHPGKVRSLPGHEAIFEEENIQDTTSIIDHSGEEDEES